MTCVAVLPRFAAATGVLLSFLLVLMLLIGTKVRYLQRERVRPSRCGSNVGNLGKRCSHYAGTLWVLVFIGGENRLEVSIYLGNWKGICRGVRVLSTPCSALPSLF